MVRLNFTSRFRFSLRTVLVLFTVTGCVLALYVKARALKMREMSAIERMPAQYGHPTPTGDLCSWPLSMVLGADFFQHVRSLQVWSYDSEACKLIADFPYLERIHIRVDKTFGPRLSNADLAYCKSLTYLDELYIEGSCFDDSALRHFSQCRPSRVVLRFMRVNGSGLRYLNATEVETLSLYRIPLTDDGMQSLKAFHNLKNLEIQGGDITTSGMRSLSELHSLEMISLTNVNIGNAGLGYLPRTIRQLSLREVSLTDDAIDQLAGTNLEQLVLLDTQITAAGINRLRTLLPNCKFRISPNPGVDSTTSGFDLRSHFRAYPR
ncbi:MAG: hypothetical protein ACI9HK_005531 [Pirellulaceae bacterium]